MALVPNPSGQFFPLHKTTRIAPGIELTVNRVECPEICATIRAGDEEIRLRMENSTLYLEQGELRLEVHGTLMNGAYVGVHYERTNP